MLINHGIFHQGKKMFLNMSLKAVGYFVVSEIRGNLSFITSLFFIN
jgi:hypothetical protein